MAKSTKPAKRVNTDGAKKTRGTVTQKRVAKSPKVNSVKVPAALGKTSTGLITPPNASKVTSNYKPKPSESYMSPRQLKYFREMLVRQQEQLIKQADNTVNSIRHDTTNYPDTFDRATHEENFGLELQTRGREYQLMKKIKSTIALIDSTDHGQYGYCSKCRQEIGLARLEVRLTANLCIECKTIAEEHERTQ